MLGLGDPDASKSKVVSFQIDIKSVLQWKMEYARYDESFCFKPQQGIKQQDIKENYGYLSKPYILNVHSSVKQRVRYTEKGTLSLLDSMSVSGAPFLGFVQLYFDKSFMPLKAKARIAYPFRAVFFHFCTCWRCCLVNNRHIVIGFLPVDIVERLEPLVDDDATSIHGLISGFTVDL